MELVITIWSAALCCGAICRCCKSYSTGNVIRFIPAPAAYAPQQAAVNPETVPAGVYPAPAPYPVQGQHTACKSSGCKYFFFGNST